MRGVEYPHNSSLVDRNIRARTCLLIAGKETVKLLDIENAALLENGTTSSDTQTIDEAIGHMSLEMLTCFDSNENGSCSYDAKAETWSIGCIVLELFGSGTLHFSDKDDAILPQNIHPIQLAFTISLGIHPEIERDTCVPVRFHNISEHCLETQSSKRPAAKAFLEHWISNTQPFNGLLTPSRFSLKFLTTRGAVVLEIVIPNSGRRVNIFHKTIHFDDALRERPSLQGLLAQTFSTESSITNFLAVWSEGYFIYKW